MITVRETPTGAAVKIPYELNQSFRLAFKTAKWDSYTKEWTVGPLSVKRLRTWAAEAEEAAKALAAKEESDLVDKELEAVRDELSKVLRETGQVEVHIKWAAASLELLKEAREELAAAKERKQEADAKLATSRAEAMSLLSQAIDLAAVRKAAEVMAHNMNPADRRCKESFEEARRVISKANHALQEAGLICEAIQELASANVNRPDRDHPKYIPQSRWYNVRKVQ
jgi:DNA repair exonuclease SbcCD ATPase subunit